MVGLPLTGITLQVSRVPKGLQKWSEPELRKLLPSLVLWYATGCLTQWFQLPSWA